MTPAARSILTRVTRSEDETIALGAALGARLRPGDVVALHGELGAGKTRFVRGVARGLGLDPDLVNSPTFVFVNEYAPPAPAPTPTTTDGPSSSTPARGGTATLVHIDAYRLRGEDDLDALGWDRFRDGGAILVIEWAERIAPALPAPGAPDRIDVTIEHAGAEARRVMIEAEGARLADWPGVPPRPAEGAPARVCPTCGGPATDSRPAFPFCSPRCRDADLGRWLAERYRISRAINDADLEEGA